MKKGLIKEAFRLQQIAGLAPINEVFEEEVAATDSKKFNETPVYKDFNDLVTKLLNMSADKKISREQYELILSPIAKVYMDIQRAYEAGEGTISEGIDTKNVCNIEFADVDHSDYPDYSDAYIIYAEWCDTGEPLSEDELDELNDDSDFVYDELMDQLN